MKPKSTSAAPVPPEDLAFWEITTHMSNTFMCVAGKTASDLQDRTKYKTKDDAPFALLMEILEKIEQAVTSNQEFIKVTVEPDPDGGNFIVPDPAPAAAAAAAAAAAPVIPFLSVLLTPNATVTVPDNASVRLVELKLDRPIPNDSGSMVLFSPSDDGTATVSSPDAADRFSFVAYVGTDNEQPAETDCLRFKIKTEAVDSFIQMIKDKPNAQVFLAHNQPTPAAREPEKST